MFLNLKGKNKKFFLFFINIFLSAVIIFLLMFTVSCDISDNAGNDNSDGTKLIVACDATYPPFESLKDGNVEGFDIDVAGEIARRMNREIEIIQIKWDSTYQVPEDLEFDMIISAIPIIEGKEDVIDFSIPYYVMEYMLVTLSGTDIKIKEDLKGKAMGILNSEKSYLDEDYLLNYKIEGYDDIVTMFDDLRNQNIDGVLISLPIGVNLMAENEGIYSVLEVVKSNKEFGIVFSKGSALKEEVNRILEEIREDGTFDEIYGKWFSYGF